MKLHIINLEFIDSVTRITFDTNPIEQLIGLPGFIKIENNSILFGEDSSEIINSDVISIIKNVKNLLKTNKGKDLKTPSEYYEEMMSYILSVGTPYSSFIEMLFANMFTIDVHNKNTKFWRYYQDKQIKRKLGDKSLAKHISPLLGGLFTPNKETLIDFDIYTNLDYGISFHERIWLENL